MPDSNGRPPDRGAKGGHLYVVQRTRGIRPGTPYVIAEWADESVGGLPGGVETFTEDEMRRDPQLSEALDAWRAGDEGLLMREATVVARLVRAAAAVDAEVATSLAAILNGPTAPDELEAVGADGESHPDSGSFGSVIVGQHAAGHRGGALRAEGAPDRDRMGIEAGASRRAGQDTAR
ncbi:MAG: hypothetical protein ACRDIZ_02405 [Actinomycetota bacterium]